MTEPESLRTIINFLEKRFDRSFAHGYSSHCSEFMP